MCLCVCLSMDIVYATVTALLRYTFIVSDWLCMILINWSFTAEHGRNLEALREWVRIISRPVVWLIYCSSTCIALGGCQRDGLQSFHGQRQKELHSLSIMVCPEYLLHNWAVLFPSQDEFFLILYKELYFRHIYAHHQVTDELVIEILHCTVIVSQ